MKPLVRFFTVVFLIGALGVAIAGVLFALKAAIGHVPGVPIAFGTTAGVTILGLIAWWSFRHAAPVSRHWLGNILYRGGCVCAGLLAIAGVLFAGVYGWNNPYGGLVAPFMIAVFWLNALICQVIGCGFLYFIAGR